MKQNLYIGTYTAGGSRGIYRLAFDTVTGEAALLDTYAAVDPSYVCLAHSGCTLYSVKELPLGETCGWVQAWAVGEDGALTFLNELPTRGGFPCHLTTDPDDRFLYCANYQDGSAAVFSLAADGSLSGQSDFLQHEGCGPDPDRQECAHVHCVRFTPDGRFIAVCDLGLDRVSLMPYDPEKGWGEEAAFIRCAPGAGARHIEFSADGRFAYLACEMGGRVEVFRYDAGQLSFVQAVSTLPEDFTGQNTVAAIKLSPDGRNLTVSNRGHDSLVTFAVAANGTLSAPRFISSGGACPRDLTYSPGGSFVLAANQEGGGVAVFSADRATGVLANTGKSLDIPNPSCVLFGRPLDK